MLLVLGGLLVVIVVLETAFLPFLGLSVGLLLLVRRVTYCNFLPG